MSIYSYLYGIPQGVQHKLESHTTFLESLKSHIELPWNLDSYLRIWILGEIHMIQETSGYSEYF